jgi:hypothetical protein
LTAFYFYFKLKIEEKNYKKIENKKGYGEARRGIILEQDGTQEGADISICFEAALITEKKRTLLKKNSIQK